MRLQAAPCPICSQPAEERKFRPFCSAECSNVDLDRVRGDLIAGLEHLAETLLGPPSIRKVRTWRWGKQGSLALEITGRKRGAWRSHEAEAGGGPLQLIQHARSCTIADAITWARDWTGGTPQAGHDYRAEQDARQAERDRKAREHAAEDAKDGEQRVKIARRLWAQAVPIAGTVAERYLVEVRRIPAPKSPAWPDCIRFHPPTNSLIVVATLADGSVQAVQRVRLTADAQKAPHTAETPTKVTNGVLAGAAVRLPGDATGPLLLAEGPETGLSVWAATGHETWIALGGMGGAMLPAGRRVVACRDDDPKHSPADKKMVKVVETWRSAGYLVAVATPWPFRVYNRTDFNDTLKLDGVRGVRSRAEAALNPGGGPPARLPIKVVRERLRGAVTGFFDDVRVWQAKAMRPPPVFMPDPDAVNVEDWGAVLDIPVGDPRPAIPMPIHAIKADVGSGKSVTTYAETIRLLVEMRAADDMRSAAFAVPTHKLGDEQAAIFQLQARETGLVAAVWRGMSATDPDSPSDPMCRNLEAVQDARDALHDVFKTTCKRKLDNGEIVFCPFFKECGYQRQRESEADLWIVAHEMIFGEKPATIGKLAFLVIDESVWSDGLEGVHGRPSALSLDAISHLPPLPPGTSIGVQMSQDRLDYLRNRLLDALRQSPDGPVTADAVIDSDLSLDNTREAYRLEWARFVDTGMHPGMTKAQRREAVQRAAGNATIPRMSSVWEAMSALLEDGGPQRSGWAALAMQPSEDGPVRVLHLKSRRKVRKGWQVPTLLLDATLNVDLVRPYWPDVQLTAELLADAPHQTIRQVVDRAYSKSAIEPLLEASPGYSPEEAKRRNRGLRMVHAIINREARQYDGAPVLVVTQKAVREALPGHGPMAPCIDLAHHNAVAGRDQWRNVRALIVVGRTQPAPASVERLAEALTGRAVEHVEGWYVRGDGVRHTAADGAVAIEADRHPDPIAEAIRWQVCEGELVQIIGRGRGVNRSEDDPLDVLVLTDAPLPLPVATTLQAADLVPSPADLMLAAGGVVFENAADAAAAYPHLWATRNAANHSFKRWRADMAAKPEVGAISLIESIIRGLAPTSPLIGRTGYQMAGPGKSASVAWRDPALVPDPETWLTERLGTLAWCRIKGEQPPPPSPNVEPARTLRPELPPAPAEPPSWGDMPAWSPEDLQRVMAVPDGYDLNADTLEREPMPEPDYSDRDQVGLDPGAVYGRGMLEPPSADNFTIAKPGEAPIRIRGRPGVLTQMPRSVLVWLGTPLPVGFTVDCSRSALLPDDLTGLRWRGPEPGD